MIETQISTPGKKALQVLQNLAETNFESAVYSLDKYACLSYIVLNPWMLHWRPELDVAVTLLMRYQGGLWRGETRLRRDVTTKDVTTEKIQEGRQAIKECVATLRQSGYPFAMICHIDGDEDLFNHFSGFTETEAREMIAHQLGQEVELLAND